ncbi:MAG: hypothetical protein V2A77_11135 [Pseudomonadota bacterium]
MSIRRKGTGGIILSRWRPVGWRLLGPAMLLAALAAGCATGHDEGVYPPYAYEPYYHGPGPYYPGPYYQDPYYGGPRYPYGRGEEEERERHEGEEGRGGHGEHGEHGGRH